MHHVRSMPAIAARERGSNMQVREIPRDGMRELFVTLPLAKAASLSPTAEHLRRMMAASVVAAECFGCKLDGKARSPYETMSTGPGMPLTWVLGQTSGDGLGGAHLRAVADAEARALELDGHRVGTVVDGPYAVECLLAGIYAGDVNAAADVQARATFERIEQALALADMDYCDVVRTWLFLDDILSWYGDFNRVRTAFYTERGVFDRLLPASTGIGGGNPLGAALVASVYAVKATRPEVTVEPVASPLQRPPLEYGSSFSRAVEVAMPDIRRLLISGTASIGPEKQTLHVGDVMAQTARTCEVVAAILQSRDMGWDNVTRATAYVRSAEDAGVFERHRAAHGMPHLPMVVAHNIICRRELLFELEVDAVTRRADEP